MKKLLVLLALLAVSLSAQEPTITLNGVSYTMQPHPRAFFNAALYARSCTTSGTAPKAVSGNPPWVATQAKVTSMYSTYGNPASTHNFDSTYTDGTVVAAYATAWCANPSANTNELAAAVYLLNNMQQYVSLVCNVAVFDCVNGGTGYWNGSYGPAYYMAGWIWAYELLRGQLTTLQQQTFADKWLNDLSLWGGVNGSPSTSCTNPTLVGATSVSINSSGVVTASAPYFGSGQTLQVGDWINQSTSTPGAVIASVTDSTHAVIESDQWSAMSGYSGTLFTRRGGWSAGDCGWVWLQKHDWYSPYSIIQSTTLYPSPNDGFGGYGGVNGSSGSDNHVLAATYGLSAVFFSLANDDVNYSSRTSVELTALYNYWYTNTWKGQNEYLYTGFTPTGSVYGIWRAQTFYPGTSFNITNSLVSPPPLLNGLWGKNFAHHMYMASFPSCPAEEQEYGQSFSPQSSYNAPYLGWVLPALPALVSMYQTNNEGQYLNYWMQNLWQTCPNGGYSGNTPGTNLMWNNLGSQSGGAYLFYLYFYSDSAYATNSALPTGTVDNCSDAGCSGAVSTSVALPMAGMISRTGYSSITDTLVNFYQIATGSTVDHTVPENGDGQPGDLRIFKGGFLLGDDWTTYNNGGPSASDVSIGADSDFPTVPYTGLMPAGANDASGRYTYALTDSTASYKSGAGVTGALRYVVHFKKPSTQDFVVVYDYVKTSAAQAVIDYWHYPQTTHTTFSGSTVTSSFPGTGHSDTAQLLTKFLQPAGSNTTYAYVNNSNGTYSGGNGDTFRVSNCVSSTGSSCGTATTSEFATVHEPVAGSGNSLPTVGMLGTIDGNHRGVEIDGSSPKVAVFPIGISEPTFNSVTFTTAVPGTAQFLVTGLTPGTYNVTVNGSTVVSGAGVVAGNNSLYFEAGSGPVVVSASGGTSYTLSTATAGTGSGTVTGSSCAGNYAAGTAWSCTASPNSGSTFTSWSDTCGGTPAGNVDSGVMPSSNCVVTATFTANTTYTLSTSTAGTGSGSFSGTCAGNWASGTAISCTANAASGSAFVSMTNTCGLSVSGNVASGSMPASACSVTATFNTATVLTLTAGTCSTSISGTQYVAFAGCQLSASGGTPPYTFTWSKSSSYASLPEGLVLNSSSGALSGTFYGQGGYVPQFIVTDSASNSATLSSITFNLAGNNTPTGCSLFPTNSAFHINVSGLPVDTSPAAPIYSGYTSTALKVFFGPTQYANQPNGIPFLLVPSTQANVNVATTVYQSYFTSGPYPSYAPVEGSANSVSAGNDGHTLIVQQAPSGGQCSLWEMWQGVPPYISGASGGAWSDSSNAYWANIGSTGTGAFAMLPQGKGSTDAAGLPVAPLVVNASEVIGTGTPTAPNGSVQHPIRFTTTNTLARYVWPATAKAGVGSCTGGYSDSNGMILQGTGAPTSCATITGPMGEIYRLKASVATPSCASTSPQASIIIAGLRNYGIILADNGSTGGLIGTPDSRWNASDLACLSNLTLGNFEPVNVSSVIATYTPNYNGSGYAAPVTSYQTTAATYTLTTATTGSGSGTVTGGGAYASGASYNLAATPSGGSYFTGWTSSPSCGGTASGSTYSGTMPSSNCTATASFTLIALTGITVTPASASIAVSGTQQYTATCTYNNSTTANCTTTSTWTSSSTGIATVGASTGLATGVAAGSTTIEAAIGAIDGTAPLSVTAAPTYTLTANTAGSGSGTLTGDPSCAGSYTAGTSVGCTATPAAGSTLTSLTNTCGLTLSGSSVTGTMPASACSVTATFTLITTYTVTTSTTGTGSGTLTGTTCAGTWASGTAVSCTATAAGGSYLSNLSATGSLTVSGSVASGTLTSNSTATATFTLIALTSITVTPANASIAVGATQQYVATCHYNNGSSSTCTSTVTWSSLNTSYATINSSGLASGVGAGTATIQAALSGVDGTASLTVTAAPTYTITTATAGTGSGTVTGTICAGSWTVGTAYSCTATPATGSAFVSYSSTCGGAASGNIYSGNMQAANCTVTATFNLVSYSMTASTAGSGSGTITGSSCNGSWHYQAAISCTATANTGSDFISWANTCGFTASGAILSGSMPAANCTATATFSPRVLASIAVTPLSVYSSKGNTVQFTATCTYTDSTTSNCTTSSTWTSSSTGVATINSTTGLATTIANGSTTIQAAIGSIHGTATLLVGNIQVIISNAKIGNARMP